MKAISLWQPWASLWVRGVKVHETRHWPTRHRGWTLVHAAKRTIKPGELPEDLALLCMRTFGMEHQKWWDRLPRGALIGAVRIDHCQPTDLVLRNFLDADQPDNFICGNFADGRYAWRAGDRMEFKKPIPWRGRQGFFDVEQSALKLETFFWDAAPLVEPQR